MYQIYDPTDLEPRYISIPTRPCNPADFGLDNNTQGKHKFAKVDDKDKPVFE